MTRTTVAGLAEIATATGMAQRTVKGWRMRGLLDPFQLDGTVSGAPAYDLESVMAWHAADAPKSGRPAKVAKTT